MEATVEQFDDELDMEEVVSKKNKALSLLNAGFSYLSDGLKLIRKEGAASEVEKVYQEGGDPKNNILVILRDVCKLGYQYSARGRELHSATSSLTMTIKNNISNSHISEVIQKQGIELLRTVVDFLQGNPNQKTMTKIEMHEEATELFGKLKEFTANYETLISD